MNWLNNILRFCKFYSFPILILTLTACHPEIKHKPIVVQPELLYTKEALSYPVEAFNLGIEGTTVIRLMVDTEGNITESTILESSGSPILDHSALKMVNSSVYEPGTIDGDPALFELHVPVQFKLDNTYDLLEDLDNWLEQTLKYREEIENATSTTKTDSYEKLFNHYQELAREIGYTRSKSANDIILDIVEESVRKPWVEYRKKWPLGFLLYEDYIKRYTDSEYISNTIDELISYLERDKKILEHYTYSKKPYATIYSLILNELIKVYDKKLF
jgi:protein TonB